MARDDLHFRLRIPASIKAEVEASALANNRSMTAEIISRLSDDRRSLRDWFAGQIASGMAAHSGTAGPSYGPQEIAQRAYEIADAMLAERAKP